MAPVIPDPARISAFQNEAEFETWLRDHHDTQTELWLRIYRKGSDTPTITYAQALDVALCWGWIDGLKKAYDEVSFLQRFTPRQAKSIWSQINRDHVERLTGAGRMTPHGQVHIDAAKAAVTRAKKIETFVAMLARGETVHPNASRKAAGAQ
jgi:uncharacterized protein YdeI (YjbR/CyaY-like superfamily)